MHRYDYLNQYYSVYDEQGRLGSRHGSVEFLTTMRYLERYLFAGARVCEIGAGTGRYSHHLARAGYAVDAVELIAHNIAVFESLTEPGECVTVRQGDACDLACFGDAAYDITLLLGPMYHLFTEGEKRAALSEAIRVTKPGGVVFAAYCGNDATVVRYLFGRGMINDPVTRGMVDLETFKCADMPSELFALYRPSDIDALMAGFAVERLHFVGTDMATNYMREVVDAMDDATFGDYLRYHFSVCERQDLVGASHHYLDVFRRR